ncbi:MAG TPA: ABC transporter ATP-binding protein [Acetobacteraceae bacterium]|nr:ABC transporter ATP-binding protein [Acetobacteraceae bacterium]
MSDPPLLALEGVGVSLTANGARLVEDVSFTLGSGESFGIVGESGSGKSTTIRAIIGLLPDGLRATGQVVFSGENIAGASEARLARLRGAGIGMVFQDPLSALNPVMLVGRQIAEALRWHGRLDPAARRRRMIEVMRLVGLPEPERLASSYPHELSGGQRQRVALAIALACAPRLLLADEPTTALDVTIQDQILRLLDELRRSLGMALVLVTHDLGVIARVCARVAVMYAGRIVEEAPVARLFAAPAHPYTRMLLDSIPQGPRACHPLAPIPGRPPDPAHRPRGCGFAPRCPLASVACTERTPPWRVLAAGGGFACFHPLLAEATTHA